jgi:hypothetical protein
MINRQCMCRTALGAGISGIEQTAAGEPAQHAGADLLADAGNLRSRQCRGAMLGPVDVAPCDLLTRR